MLISGQKISDASSGFRAYSKDAIQKLKVNSELQLHLRDFNSSKRKRSINRGGAYQN